MSLSLTPINEAWQIQKIKKSKIQNNFSNHDTQVKILRDSDQLTHSKEIIPSGSNLSEKNYKPISQVTPQDDDHISVSPKNNLLINFDNPLVIDYLSKYKESFAE